MVEDVADDAALLERELRRAGIAGATRRVDSERAYREALRTFAPDIILTDHSSLTTRFRSGRCAGASRSSRRRTRRSSS